jgi:hypothetical protein
MSFIKVIALGNDILHSGNDVTVVSRIYQTRIVILAEDIVVLNNFGHGLFYLQCELTAVTGFGIQLCIVSDGEYETAQTILSLWCDQLSKPQCSEIFQFYIAQCFVALIAQYVQHNVSDAFGYLSFSISHQSESVSVIFGYQPQSAHTTWNKKLILFVGFRHSVQQLCQSKNIFQTIHA